MDFNGVVSKMMQYSSFWFVSGCPLEGRIVALKTKKQLYQKKKKKISETFIEAWHTNSFKS